jgi:hypothetical protein
MPIAYQPEGTRERQKPLALGLPVMSARFLIRFAHE